MPTQHRWSAAAARRAIDHYGAEGISEELALRTYSARLLGADPDLVLHGGGNTSVKTSVCGLLGETIPVLRVKGSGWDLATIEPPGHPAVRLEPLQQLRGLDALSDEAMVAAQRQNLIDPKAPNPSVEALLHAFLPHTFIDHTHAIALLALADQPNAAELCQEVYGDRVALVPYVMPGFALAKAAAEAYEAAAAGGAEIEGLVLLQHGLFSFGATAEQSYDRMIRLVQAAEELLSQAERRILPAAVPSRPTPASALLPVLRGLLHRAAGPEAAPGRWLLDCRSSAPALELVNDQRLSRWASCGVATPDHVIRTKAGPLVLPAAPPAPNPVASLDSDGPDTGSDSPSLAAWSLAAAEALEVYIQAYRAYFERQDQRLGGGRTRLDSLPRLIAIPGLGLVGIGRSSAEAAVAADIGEVWARTLLAAEALGRFAPVGEDDTFEMEYWSLEQAKLGKGSEPALARQVVVVTGGGGAIGAATARAFAAQGAELAVLDRDGPAALAVAASCGPRALGLACDLTDPDQVNAALASICARFGGLDVVVSNAGAAWTGAIAELAAAELRASFELNFFAHQTVAQAAVAIFRAQGFGGQLLFNVSKQALNPGANFGAYGIAKAALLALMRQYALEGGGEGIRANAINADRIRSGLLDDAMIQARATARGVSTATYMAGNLLGQEVAASDVAEAFVALAALARTTGAVLTVDGGNVAAMVR
ncbi:bifunctional aldolase/short-chain dehydrogenase [Synechococcus sp. CS-602]|uniref:bifunctional aldolase/short-chain dehydrogenase n=1 Tax=Synechococcaceae TaxID=1890426 RepID=UPI0008FF243B|nr:MULTISPECIES: bifunctional aldolase/short-chain dehydrogenase [Synechococcaceae]MCT4363960.1 bifunctional aldolase/short-chain dehydrogenase [Candidatus Regnicoccus frigidus MAG-AL1]APD48424.1 short-chain dehydrogenase [Synechococcus sp. SynAce01]MCT0201324.1 bifunctional aldolase/short-chain dehydrogenase [Synechococcus sp. CS-603]MCT0205874.1 bifunctional aldolase/short-chain dehydrogenase [Synechococcus sp. CS-602]MCT0245980.1 bifunctional aldolase/short-chain dehydrogenase [Synechococcu